MTFVRDLADTLGMEWENTGGGCMALVRRLPDGSAIVITDVEDNYSCPDWDADTYVTGAYVQHVQTWDDEHDDEPVLVYASPAAADLPWPEDGSDPVPDLAAERAATIAAVRAYVDGLGL